MSVIGYARVGSIGQKLDVQKDKLTYIYLFYIDRIYIRMLFDNLYEKNHAQRSADVYKDRARNAQRLLAASKRVHRPAAQIVRDLMRAYLAQRKEPNNETLAAMEAIEQGDVNTYATVDDFYDKIGI